MLQLPNAQLSFQSDFLSKEESKELYQYLILAIPWENQQITIFGKTLPCPRLEAFFAADGLTYGYSGNRLTTNTFTPVLAALKKRVEEKAGTDFN